MRVSTTMRLGCLLGLLATGLCLTLNSSALLCAAEQAATAEKKPADEKKADADKKPADEKKPEDKKDEVTNSVILGEIELHGSFPEGAPLPGIFGELSENLSALIARIEKAGTDPKIDGILLRINEPQLGWGSLAALQQAIAKVQGQGKKVYAYLDGASTQQYLLAASCDEITMPESGMLMLVGLRAEVGFYKNLFDLIGIKAEMLRVGEYKSAAEPYTRTEMSPAFRQEMEEMIDDYWQQITETIAKARKLKPEQVAEIIDNGPQSAQFALQSKLIDRIGYEDELESSIKKSRNAAKISVVKRYGKKKIDTDFSGLTGMVKFMELMTGAEPTRRKSVNPKIAVIYAIGPIMTGKSQSDLFGDSTMGSETMVKAIREAANDETVKAVVLRVNSPGGSALASDLMWRELELLKKPFVVSMGDVAASGGYYIAMGSDRIFAEPGTLTGSIGVVGGKMALQGLYEKIGITTSTITRGKNAGIFSSTTPFTDSERKSMQSMLNEIYDQFTGKAAAGRKMEKAALEKLARGRVYTGRQAVKIGLVDELGSLEDAIAYAVKQAGLKPEDKIERLQLPKAVNPLESLFGPIDAQARSAAGLSDAGHPASRKMLLDSLRSISPDLARSLKNLHLIELFRREPAVLIMPYQVEVK